MLADVICRLFQDVVYRIVASVGWSGGWVHRAWQLFYSCSCIVATRDSSAVTRGRPCDEPCSVYTDGVRLSVRLSICHVSHSFKRRCRLMAAHISTTVLHFLNIFLACRPHRQLSVHTFRLQILWPDTLEKHVAAISCVRCQCRSCMSHTVVASAGP